MNKYDELVSKILYEFVEMTKPKITLSDGPDDFVLKIKLILPYSPKLIMVSLLSKELFTENESSPTKIARWMKDRIDSKFTVAEHLEKLSHRLPVRLAYWLIAKWDRISS